MRTIMDFAEPGERLRLQQFIRGLPARPHVVEIKRFHPSRTNAQNQYYWGVVVPVVMMFLAECWGEDVEKEDAHEEVRRLFLTASHTDRRTGEVITIPRSTTTLSTREFAGYLDSIIKLVAEHGYEVPVPRWYREAVQA